MVLHLRTPMLSALIPTRSVGPSGLVALAQALPGVHRSVLTFFLRTGARFESEADSGLSHFLEHMLFRGTPSHPSAHELATAFEDLGGTLVASTAADHGNLAIAVPPENLSAALARLREVVTSPLLGGIELERGIIREEILEDLNDDGQWIDGATLIRQLAFGDHGLGRPITGTIEHIERFGEADVRRHFARTYVGAGSVVSAVGPFDADAVLQELEEAFSSLPRGERLLGPPAPPARGLQHRLVRQRGSNQSALHVGFRCPGDQDPLEPALEMLLRIIDDGMATRLYHRLCDTRGLCYDAAASYEAYEDTGLVEFATETANERAADVLEELLQMTEELAAEGATSIELDRARRRARWQHEAMLDDPDDIADFLALSELSGTARTPAARLEELLAVSLEDVRAAAQTVFRGEARSIAIVGNPKAAVAQRLERLATR